MDAPKIPTLKDSQKPQVKVRGLEAGVTLFDRLKQFKKKDLAFILAGLGTLFMAPLAEHFMMAPEQGSDLAAGIGGGRGGSGSGLFSGNGSSPYETTGGLAAGGPSGGLSDIITPLNVRDPSALVMGPGATQQPPTQSVAPATPPPTAPSTKDSDLRDALAASGAHAAGAATRAAKALLPVPKVALSGAGGLRGLGVTSGGSSATAGLSPISAANVSGKANSGGGGLNLVKSTPGYRGAAGGRSGTQGGGGLEALKAAAEKQGSAMNQGSASTALDNAAAQQIPGGGSGLGGNGAGGTGATDKPFGGDQDKSSKNVGESLDFLKKKAMQEKQIELWAKEKEANDGNLLAAQLRNDALKTIVGEAAKSLAQCPANILKGAPCIDPSNGGAIGYACTVDGTPNTFVPKSKISDSCKDGVLISKIGTKIVGCGGIKIEGCQPIGGSDAGLGGNGTPPGDDRNPMNVGKDGKLIQPSPDETKAVADLKDVCANMEAIAANPKVKINKQATTDYMTGVVTRARQLIVLRDALYNGDSKDCTTNAKIKPDASANTLDGFKDGKTVADLIRESKASLASDAPGKGQTATDLMMQSVPQTEGDAKGGTELEKGRTPFTAATALFKKIGDTMAQPSRRPAQSDEFLSWFTGPNAKVSAAQYDRQLTNAEAALQRNLNMVNVALNGGGQGTPSVYDGLTVSVGNLDAISKGKEATLPKVIQTNGTWKKTVDGLPPELKAAAAPPDPATTTDPAATAPKPNLNLDTMNTAITKASASIDKSDDPAVIPVSDAVKAYNEAKAKNDPTLADKKTAAETSIKAARDNVKAMDDTQTGWLTNVAGQINKSVSALPAKGQ